MSGARPMASWLSHTIQFATPARMFPRSKTLCNSRKGRIQLDVELKEPDCERDAIDLLLRYFPLSDFCITSFLAPTLRATRAIHPGIRTGLIFAFWNKSVRAACRSPDIDLLVAHHRLLDEAEDDRKATVRVDRG